MHYQIRRFYKSRLFSVKKKSVCLYWYIIHVLQANFDCELIVKKLLPINAEWLWSNLNWFQINKIWWWSMIADFFVSISNKMIFPINVMNSLPPEPIKQIKNSFLHVFALLELQCLHNYVGPPIFFFIFIEDATYDSINQKYENLMFK